MKTLFVAFICALISVSAVSQDVKYARDNRPQNMKEDRHDMYQTGRIGELELLKALEMAGVRIFSIPISPAFEREYRLSLHIDEYVKGEKVNSIPVLDGANTYIHFPGDTMPPYFDYFPKLTLFTLDSDTAQTLSVHHYGGSRSGIVLKRIRIEEWQRPGQQSYTWRAYSKTDWKLNEDVPLLVYASAWYDEKYKIFRFCGVVDLSHSEEATRELFDNSPHYYVISLKVSE
jgi:hypothetical protein